MNMLVQGRKPAEFQQTINSEYLQKRDKKDVQKFNVNCIKGLNSETFNYTDLSE